MNKNILQMLCVLLLLTPGVLLCAQEMPVEQLWPSIETYRVGVDGGLGKLESHSKELKKHWVEVSRDNFSLSIVSAGSLVDDYISGDPEFLTNESFGRLRLTEIIEENGQREFNSDFKLKVDLPKMKKRGKLIIDSSLNEFDDLEDDDTNRPDQAETDNENSGFSAALRYSFEKKAKYNGSFDIGMKAKLPLNPFVRVEFGRVFSLTDKWEMMWRNKIFYFHEEGAGAESRLDFGRQVATNFYFNNSVRAKWKNKENIVQYSDVITLSQYIDERRSMNYATGIFYQEKPDEKKDAEDYPDLTEDELEALREGVSSYYVSITYRKKMYEDWLVGEVTPSVSWYRGRDFDALTAISFRIEVLFR